MMTKDTARLGNLDVLRALAALGVCLFHLSLTGFLHDPLLSGVLKLGYHGVEVFFVISGFVNPLALSGMKFRMTNSGVFLLSRFLRLYPAYLAAGLFTLALWYISAQLPMFRGSPLSLNVLQVIGNLTLTCDFIQEPWWSLVFWSLAIEAQFYFLIAATFALLTDQSRISRYLALLAWIGVPWLVGLGPTVLSWTALFAMGVLGFLKKQNLLSAGEFWLLLALALLCHGQIHGLASAAAGGAAVLALLYMPEVKSRLLIWVGTISYSLYLLHVIIGGRVINLLDRFALPPWMRLPGLLLALAVSVAAGTVFYALIERPSHEFSRRVKRYLNRRIQGGN